MGQKIGIYPGTFDPVHQGHIDFAEQAAVVCGLDEVYFLPELTPRYKIDVTDINHRVNLLNHAVHNHSNLKVLRLSSKQFTTAQTMPELLNIFPEDQFTLLMGSDVANNLHKWIDIDQLLTRFSLAVGMRSGDNKQVIDNVFNAILKKQNHSFEYTFIDTTSGHVASSQIRSGNPAAVPHPATQDYIQKHRLYR